MTITACVKVYDGIALGCDSATQISGSGPGGQVGVLKIYRNARKLFRFQGLRAGLLTHGVGNLGEKSIQTLLRDFDATHKFSEEEGYTIEGITHGLYGFFSEIYGRQIGSMPLEQRPVLGFYMAGYSSNSNEGEEWEFLLPRDERPRLIRDKTHFGSSWRGISIPFTRLYFGYDPRAKDRLLQSGVTEEQFKQVFDPIASPVIYNGMPLKDAVKFVKFVLETTINMAYFEIGPESCSEPIQVAVVDPTDGFKWVYKPILEMEGGNKT